MKKSLVLVWLVVLIFFVISFLTNIIGPLVPDIIDSFNLSLTLVALLPFAFFIAYGVMSIPSGMMIEKFVLISDKAYESIREMRPLIPGGKPEKTQNK